MENTSFKLGRADATSRSRWTNKIIKSILILFSLAGSHRLLSESRGVDLPCFYQPSAGSAINWNSDLLGELLPCPWMDLVCTWGAAFSCCWCLLNLIFLLHKPGSLPPNQRCLCNVNCGSLLDTGGTNPAHGCTS